MISKLIPSMDYAQVLVSLLIAKHKAKDAREVDSTFVKILKIIDTLDASLLRQEMIVQREIVANFAILAIEIRSWSDKKTHERILAHINASVDKLRALIVAEDLQFDTNI